MPHGTRSGNITTALSAIATGTTSSEIALGDYPSIYVEVDVTGSGAWTVTVTGSLTSGGTFVALTDVNNVAMSTGSLSADGAETFRGCPPYIKVVGAEDSGTATITVKVMPVNI